MSTPRHIRAARQFSRFGPCMCGATDCPSCGPAQGYSLDDEERDNDFDEPDDYPDDRWADQACDQYERELDARASQ